MDDKLKRKKEILERFAKQVSEGNPLSEDFLPPLPDDIVKQYPNRIADLRANQAGQLAEQALAHQVLKNTGVPIPSDFSNQSKTEDFFSRILKERYPEFEPNIEIRPDKEVAKVLPDASGFYLPSSKKIVINQDELTGNNPMRAVSTLLHEGGHQYDDQILKFNGTQTTMAKDLVKNAPKNRLITDIDPTEAYELMAKGHHANIPDLREGTYGLGALKSFMKSGKFKATGTPLDLVMQSFGGLDIPEERPKANPVAQAKIAEAYEKMQHNPNDPAVKNAYQSLINEIEGQYDDLINNKGLKVSRIEGENPYKSSKDLINDVKNNKHMAYYPTEIGYGPDGTEQLSDHPLLQKTKHLGPDGKPMPANDMFRVVHDYYGHVEGENKFGATGEERAFQQHAKMLSPEAQKALATETRGQNSWVNYGPEGTANRANPANTKFAEQKAGLLPDWTRQDLQDIENPTLGKINKASKLAARVMPAVGMASAVVPVVADLKEGKPNTALARTISYGAPFGSEEITDKLMEDAKLRDNSPELYSPTYMRTIQGIAERRRREGKSPIVESFSGQQIDTSAEDDSDFVNLVKKRIREESNG